MKLTETFTLQTQSLELHLAKDNQRVDVAVQYHEERIFHGNMLEFDKFMAAMNDFHQKATTFSKLELPRY